MSASVLSCICGRSGRLTQAFMKLRLSVAGLSWLIVGLLSVCSSIASASGFYACDLRGPVVRSSIDKKNSRLLDVRFRVVDAAPYMSGPDDRNDTDCKEHLGKQRDAVVELPVSYSQSVMVGNIVTIRLSAVDMVGSHGYSQVVHTEFVALEQGQQGSR